MIKATNKLEPNTKAINSNYKHHERKKITLTANIINETTVLGGRAPGRTFHWGHALAGNAGTLVTGITLLQVMLGHWSSLQCPCNSAFWLTRPVTCSVVSPTIMNHSCQRFTVMRSLSLGLEPLES